MSLRRRPVSAVSMVLALGDSLSSGTTDRGPDGRPLGWARRTANLLGARQSTAPWFVGLASDHSGVQDVLADQFVLAVDILTSTHTPASSALVGITVGINDVRRGVDPGEFATAYDDLVAGLSATGTTVVTVTMPDPPGTLGLSPDVRAHASTTLEQFNDKIRMVSRARSTILLDASTSPEVRRRDFWGVDEMHPSATGHVVIATAALTSLFDREAGLVERKANLTHGS